MFLVDGFEQLELLSDAFFVLFVPISECFDFLLHPLEVHLKIGLVVLPLVDIILDVTLDLLLKLGDLFVYFGFVFAGMLFDFADLVHHLGGLFNDFVFFVDDGLFDVGVEFVGEALVGGLEGVLLELYLGCVYTVYFIHLLLIPHTLCSCSWII